MLGKEDSLLKKALGNLQTTTADEALRRQKYEINKKVVSQVRLQTDHDNLQVQPNIDGQADNQRPLPIQSCKSFTVDLNKLQVPSQCGGQSLLDVIQEQCRIRNINIKMDNLDDLDDLTDMSTASFTTVVAAVAGQHAVDDTACTGGTKAEFVPVYNNSSYSEKRVLAICYSTNGETELRVDNLLIHPKTRMTCLSRQGSRPKTALQATEISSTVATEMKEATPAEFTQLQKSSCLVAFVEFAPEVVYSFDNDDRNSMSTCSLYRGSPGSETPSPYSVIGQGSEAKDHSVTIHETAPMIVRNIDVYAIAAMVVNIPAADISTLPPNVGRTIGDLMQARAKELNDFYWPHRKPSEYDALSEPLLRIASKYKDIGQRAVPSGANPHTQLGKALEDLCKAIQACEIDRTLVARTKDALRQAIAALEAQQDDTEKQAFNKYAGDKTIIKTVLHQLEWYLPPLQMALATQHMLLGSGAASAADDRRGVQLSVSNFEF